MATTENIGRARNISSSAPVVELRQSLASRASDISPFVDQLMGFIKLFALKLGIAKETEDEIEIAVLEALANAVIHGNGESPDKQVHLSCRFSMDGEVSIVVRDEGEGFDSRAVPDPTEPQGLLLTYGRDFTS
jgi:anti-sigma regulatory factor (Ser/Thr protein kinase)